jgi:antitoxin component of MazEF toxin-antitoxin module
MDIVRIRKVGNSNVITLPRELRQLGFTEGTQIVVEATAEGEVRLIPANNLRAAIRASGRKVAREHREALDILSEAEDTPPAANHTSAVAD